jgi:hypothetical protein
MQLHIQRKSTFSQRFKFFATAILLALLMSNVARMQTAKSPYDKDRLLKIVSLNALSTSEIVKAIDQRGVDFQMTAEVEEEFKQAGARPELLDAMRRSYRPKTLPPSKVSNDSANNSAKKNLNATKTTEGIPAGPPLSKNEVVTLLKGGTPAARVEQIVEVRGVNFALNSQTSKEISAAGGNRSLLGAISERAPEDNGPSPSSSSPSVSTTNAPASKGPDYDELTDQAISSMQEGNFAGAIRLLQTAMAVDTAKPTAYQLLGFAYLYGNKDITSAETNMRAALERNGVASFRIYHDHDGNFKKQCLGTFFVSRSAISFKADDGIHIFEAEKVKIQEMEIYDFGGSAYGAFRVKILQEEKKKSSKYLNFTPAATKKDESKLVVSLVKSY